MESGRIPEGAETDSLTAFCFGAALIGTLTTARSRSASQKQSPAVLEQAFGVHTGCLAYFLCTSMELNYESEAKYRESVGFQSLADGSAGTREEHCVRK